MFVSDAKVSQDVYREIMTSKYPKMIPGNLYVIHSSDNCMRVKKNHEYGTLYFDKDTENNSSKNIGILVKFIDFNYQDGFEFVELIYGARNCEFTECSNRFYVSEAEFTNLKIDDVTKDSKISDFNTLVKNKSKLNRKVSEVKEIISGIATILFALALVIGMALVICSLPGKVGYIAAGMFILCIIGGLGSGVISRLIYRNEIKNMCKARKRNNHQYIEFIVNHAIRPKFYYYSDEYRSIFCDKEDQEFYSNENYSIYDDTESCENVIHSSIYEIV